MVEKKGKTVSVSVQGLRLSVAVGCIGEKAWRVVIGDLLIQRWRRQQVVLWW